jgi:hypothetical protein
MSSQETKECRLCGKLLTYFEGCGRPIKDLVPGGHDPRLCRNCEKQIVTNYLISKGAIDDPETLAIGSN